jgi:hypothetical protein
MNKLIYNSLSFVEILRGKQKRKTSEKPLFFYSKKPLGTERLNFSL